MRWDDDKRGGSVLDTGHYRVAVFVQPSLGLYFGSCLDLTLRAYHFEGVPLGESVRTLDDAKVAALNRARTALLDQVDRARDLANAIDNGKIRGKVRR